MKVVKILVPVNLNSGLETPKNTLCTIAEGYADIKSAKNGLIPSQIATLLYLDASSITNPDVQPISGIADYSPLFQLSLSETSYSTDTAEDLLVNGVYNELIAVYGEGNVSIVTI